MLALQQLLTCACEVLDAQSQHIERLKSETHVLRQQKAFLLYALEYTLGQKQALERQFNHRKHSEFRKRPADVLRKTSNPKLITWRNHPAKRSVDSGELQSCAESELLLQTRAAQTQLALEWTAARRFQQLSRDGRSTEVLKLAEDCIAFKRNSSAANLSAADVSAAQKAGRHIVKAQTTRSPVSSAWIPATTCPQQPTIYLLDSWQRVPTPAIEQSSVTSTQQMRMMEANAAADVYADSASAVCQRHLKKKERALEGTNPTRFSITSFSFAPKGIQLSQTSDQQRKSFRDVLILALSSPTSWRRLYSSPIQPSFARTIHHVNLQREAEVSAAAAAVAAATDSGDYRWRSQKKKAHFKRFSQMMLFTSPQRPIECFAHPNPFAALGEGNVEQRQADMDEKWDTTEQDVVEEESRRFKIPKCGLMVRPLAAFADFNPFSCLM